MTAQPLPVDQAASTSPVFTLAYSTDPVVEFRQRFGFLLRGEGAATLLDLCSQRIGDALSAEGYLLDAWVPVADLDQRAGFCVAQRQAGFRDPLGGNGFTACVRLNIAHVGPLHIANLWVVLCHTGERDSSPNSVCLALVDQSWRDLTHAEVWSCIERQLDDWALPESAKLISKGVANVAAGLTSVLAP